MYERTDTLTLQVKFTPLLESIISLSSSDIGKRVTMNQSTLSIPGVRKSTRECQVENVETFSVNISGSTQSYSGITILPRDRVMLVDFNNSQCILLNNSHQVVTTYKFTEKAIDICVVGDEEVAVSVSDQKKIQILSVRDGVISPVRTITTKHEIKEMRKKINTALDEFEMKVKMEGRRIHKEVAIRTQEENHQCLSLIHAIRNSQLLCETVPKYGIDIQKFLTAAKIKSQLPLYYSQIIEKYERTDIVKVQGKFTPLLESNLSFSSSDIGKLVTMTCSTHPIPMLREPTKECQVENVEKFSVNISEGTQGYSGITILPRDRVMLVDHNNDQCILLNNSHQVVTTYKLKEKPCDICVVGDEEVAVSVYNQKKIQILSVRDGVISPVRTITTKHKCIGIATAGKGEMVAVGDCGNNKYCWSLIRDGREVNYSDQYDSSSGFLNYTALNNSKTRVYVTVSDKNSLHCFNMEGKTQYTYSHDNLECALGVAVDRDDNIYVVGCNSHNIHQLSPEGCIIQVITTGVLRYPRAISFDNSRDTFIITNFSEKQKLHIYQLK